MNLNVIYHKLYPWLYILIHKEITYGTSMQINNAEIINQSRCAKINEALDIVQLTSIVVVKLINDRQNKQSDNFQNFRQISIKVKSFMTRSSQIGNS